MKYIAGRMKIRLSALALIALTAGLTVGRADILQVTAALPPPAGVYTLPVVCIAPVCLVNATISGFQVASDILSAGNELVSTNAIFAASIFQNNGGNPGSALGPLSIGGTVDFTFFGRSLTTPLGSFNAQITGFDFVGTFNSHPFEVRQNPLMASTGVTTINQVSPNGLYQVSSFFDVFAELSLDNGPFIPGPVRHTTVSDVPEPGSWGFVGLGLLGLLVRLSRGSTFSLRA